MIRELGKTLAGKFFYVAVAAFDAYRRIDNSLNRLDGFPSASFYTTPFINSDRFRMCIVPATSIHAVTFGLFGYHYGNSDTAKTAQEWKKLANFLDSAIEAQDHIKAHCTILSSTLKQIADYVSSAQNNQMYIQIPMTLINTLGERINGFDDAAEALERRINKDLKEKFAGVSFISDAAKQEHRAEKFHDVELLRNAKTLIEKHFRGFLPQRYITPQARPNLSLVQNNTGPRNE